MNTPSTRFPWGEAVVPGLTLAFTAAYFLQSLDAPWVALYWPIIIAIVLGVLWAAVVLRYLLGGRSRKPRNHPAPSGSTAGMGRPGLVLGGSVGYLAAVQVLGFSLTNVSFMLLLFRGLGSRRWTRNICVAVGVALFLHLALIGFMKLSLPRLQVGPLFI